VNVNTVERIRDSRSDERLSGPAASYTSTGAVKAMSSSSTRSNFPVTDMFQISPSFRPTVMGSDSRVSS
jgi:hypothetical protein